MKQKSVPFSNKGLVEQEQSIDSKNNEVHCSVSLIFSETNDPSVRRKVADLLITAFEKQIGVREKT